MSDPNTPNTRKDRIKARLAKYEQEAVAIGQIVQQIKGSVNEVDDELKNEAEVLSYEEKEQLEKQKAKFAREYLESNTKYNDLLGRIRSLEEMLAVENDPSG